MNTKPEHEAIQAFFTSLAASSSKGDYIDQIANLLTGGGCDLMTLDCSTLRFQHVQAVRSRLTEHYAPALERVSSFLSRSSSYCLLNAF